MPEPVGSWPAGTYPYSTISQPGSRQAGIETENQTCICTHHHTQRQQPAKEGAGAAYAHCGRPMELPCRDSWPHSCATGAHPQRQESAPKSRLRGSGAAHRQCCHGVPSAPPRDARRRRSAPAVVTRPSQPPISARERHYTSVRESPSCGQNASGQLQQASQRHAEAADCGQLVTERRREVISRGSRHAGRGAAGEGDGRRLTCACRALRPWCRGRRRLTSDGRCSGHSVRAQRLRAADLASHATVLSDRRLGSLLGGHEAPPFAAAGPRRVQEGRGADRRSRMEVGTRAAGVLPPTI